MRQSIKVAPSIIGRKPSIQQEALWNMNAEQCKEFLSRYQELYLAVNSGSRKPDDIDIMDVLDDITAALNDVVVFVEELASSQKCNLN